MKNLRWLFPAATAGILINLSTHSTSGLDWLGITFGLLYAWAAILASWEMYGRGKP